MRIARENGVKRVKGSSEDGKSGCGKKTGLKEGKKEKKLEFSRTTLLKTPGVITVTAATKGGGKEYLKKRFQCLKRID